MGKAVPYRCVLLPSKPILKHLPSSFSSFPRTGSSSFINIDFHSWVLIDPLFLLPGHLTRCSYSRPLPQWLWVIIRLSALGCAPACAQGPGSELAQHLECSTEHKMSLPCVFAFGSCIVSPSSMTVPCRGLKNSVLYSKCWNDQRVSGLGKKDNWLCLEGAGLRASTGKKKW